MKAKIYVTLLMMAMYPSGHGLAAEPWWVVGSFEKMAGATTLQARLESQLAENVWIVPHPDQPLHRVVIRVAEVSEARLDAAGITAWKTDLDFVPEPRAVRVRPTPGPLPEVSQTPALPRTRTTPAWRNHDGILREGSFRSVLSNGGVSCRATRGAVGRGTSSETARSMCRRDGARHEAGL